MSPPVTSRSLSLSELLISGLQCAKVGLISGLQCAKVGLMSGLQCAKVGLMSGLGARVAAAVSGNIALMLKEDLRGVRAITRGCSGPSILTMLTCERRGEEDFTYCVQNLLTVKLNCPTMPQLRTFIYQHCRSVYLPHPVAFHSTQYTPQSQRLTWTVCYTASRVLDHPKCKVSTPDPPTKFKLFSHHLPLHLHCSHSS